jgi:hypothetical protein
MKFPYDLRPQDEQMYRRGWNDAITAATETARDSGDALEIHSERIVKAILRLKSE